MYQRPFVVCGWCVPSFVGSSGSRTSEVPCMFKKFYNHEDDPKGLIHVATLIVYNLTLHHIVV